LVQAERQVEIGSDLLKDRCLFTAAVEHYRHHAAAEAAALDKFAADLPRRLQPEIGSYLGNRRLQLGAEDAFRLYVVKLLDQAVSDFSRSLARVQEDVDTPEEVVRLNAPCDQT
jgi:hypothetical protein